MGAMPRGLWIRTVIVAAVTCGCQSATGPRDCADCTPPKTYSCGYKPPCDNLVTKLTALGCADDALKGIKKTCGKQTRDFEAGFRQAYVDQAMGRPALVPPVPTRNYWTAYYRSCAGQQEVADWFAGYRAGLDYGAESGVSQFDRVPSSWTLGQDGALDDGALCGPPAGLPMDYGNSAPTGPVDANPAMGPYGPLLNPDGYQTPQYAAPPAEARLPRLRDLF
jgi:hypothetical protein